MSNRTNQQWLDELSQSGGQQEKALTDLRDYLLRATILYLRAQRSDLAELPSAELQQMAEDIAQESLLAIQENLNTFRHESRFTSWAYRFAINQAISTLRRRRRTPFSYDKLQADGSNLLQRLIDDPPVADPRQHIAQQNLITILRQIIDEELTSYQRIALLAVYFEERPTNEVAAWLEMTPNALYKLLHDARKKVKARLLARKLSANDILALFDDSW